MYICVLECKAKPLQSMEQASNLDNAIRLENRLKDKANRQPGLLQDKTWHEQYSKVVEGTYQQYFHEM